MQLEFRVKNQQIARVDNHRVVEKSIKYLKARFSFSPDWAGTIKTAIFSTDNESFAAILDNDMSCVVPWEVIYPTGFDVSVVGVLEEQRITTNAIKVVVQTSGFEEGETPSDPSPTVYEQILAKLEALSSGGVSDVDIEAIARLVKAQIDIPTDADITNVVRAYVESHRDELKGDPGADGINGADGRDGQDYVITASDYDAIADVVLTKISSAEGVTF